MYKFLLTLFSCLVVAGSAVTADVSGTMAKLDAEDYDLRKTARLDLLQLLAESSGAERAAMIEKLHQLIKVGNSFATRDWSIRMLEFFGDEASALPLAQLLIDDDVHIRDRARLALQANPSPAATRVLENALKGVPVEQKGAILDAIAYRGDKGSVSEIASLLTSESPVLASKAAMALGKIGGTEAQSVLLQAHASARDAFKLDIELALFDAGLSDVSVAKALTLEGQSSAVKLAAFQQLIVLDSASAKNFLETILSDDSYPGRNQFIRAALTSPMKDELISRLSSVSAGTQKIFLGVIGEQALSQYEADVLRLLESGSPEIKADASDLLGVIGSDESYPALYKLYLADPKNTEIKNTLSRIPAPAADKALLEQAAGSSDITQRVAAVELLTLRNPKGATALINQLAAEATAPELKKAVYKSMELIGNADSIDFLLASILKLDEGTRAAQGSLKKMTVSLASNESLWKVSYAPALQSTSNDDQRRAILAILDGVACQPAAAYLQDLIMSDSPLQSDALRSLARWSDVSGVEVWLAYLSRPGASESDVATALKGIKRLLSQSTVSGSQTEKLALAAKAIEVAPSLEFKQSILDTCEKMKIHRKSKAALKKSFRPFLNDPEIGDRVKALVR